MQQLRRPLTTTIGVAITHATGIPRQPANLGETLRKLQLPS